MNLKYRQLHSSFVAEIEGVDLKADRGPAVAEAIEAILDQPYVRVTRGPVVTYVWPAFALAPPAAPSEETRAQMWRCVRFAALAAAPDAAPPIERIGIGADGTWHFFWSGA